ncbi:MAG: hypothetical protein WDN03_03955 [Rhizomicrobium sp.]
MSALATTAAPTYFPLHSIDGELFADGGLHANAPDIIAISEALRTYNAPLSQIGMVSIGTTYSYREMPTLHRRNLGRLGWAFKLSIVELLLDAQDNTTVFLADRMLGERYIRINRYIEPNIANKIHLARADDFAIRTLKTAAGDAWKALESNARKLARVDNMLR